MKVVGHDDVADQFESVTITKAGQCLNEEVSVFGSLKPRQSTVTTGSDEMEMVQVVMTMETTRHGVILVPNLGGRTIIPPPLLRKDGAPASRKN